jgi:hypothetical protein
MYHDVMRTTLDIPEDLHRQIRSIAHDSRQTLSETAALLMRRGLGEQPAVRTYRDQASGHVFFEIARTVTADDVRSLDDDE